MSADNLVTLRPQGRFDFNCFRDFRTTYESALAQDGVKCVVVDLQQVQMAAEFGGIAARVELRRIEQEAGQLRPLRELGT